MRLIARFLPAFAAIGAVMLAGAVTVDTAQAALGDYCFIDATLQPGLEDNLGACQPSTPAEGFDCGNELFYNPGANQCVANNATCTVSGGGSGTYQAGSCQATPVPPTPTAPTAPVGFSLDGNAGGVPSGEMQPMCVNASPFIGGGMFVVSGTVLCYTGAGRDSGIYAYTDDGAGASGWNPFDPNTWDSLAMRDLYASDDITAEGTLSAFGGAQLYSLDGRSGLQVNNDGVLIGSSDADGNMSTINTKPEQVAIASTDGTSTSSLTVSGSNGISLTANVAEGGPAVNISGAIGEDSTAGIGVIIRGDGQGSQTAPTSGPANWADVLVASASYGSGAGAGIVVNDYGVSVRSSTTGNSYNEFGSGAANAVGSSVTNVIGSGGAGQVSNYLGVAGNAGTNVLNEIGTAGNGGATSNIIGNTNAATSVTAKAGTSSVVVIQGALDLQTTQGASILLAPTQQVSSGSAVAMLGNSTTHTVIDQNGAFRVVNGVASEASNATYLVNGYGMANGVAMNERQTVLSGGSESPTSLVMSDTGAHFSNSTTGGPVTVSGIADGEGPHDAANIRQLDSGVASVAALAGLPAPTAGKNNSFGFAMGHHNSGTAVALGGQSLIGDSLSVKYGASMSYASGRTDTTASVGVGMWW